MTNVPTVHLNLPMLSVLISPPYVCRSSLLTPDLKSTNGSHNSIRRHIDAMPACRTPLRATLCYAGNEM
ncbi:hypothetical protein VTL71DRAFT_16273 [Oculimacula yallundae]|uniref:Uncharacterized protein n=1 Tax=Oculimacula yallundae TaxID=86028 RepID=A0ABR4CE09_9HELO